MFSKTMARTKIKQRSLATRSKTREKSKPRPLALSCLLMSEWINGAEKSEHGGPRDFKTGVEIHINKLKLLIYPLIPKVKHSMIQSSLASNWTEL